VVCIGGVNLVEKTWTL